MLTSSGGTGSRGASTTLLHARPASSTVVDHRLRDPGGHRRPGGGDSANRKAPERCSINEVSAKDPAANPADQRSVAAHSSPATATPQSSAAVGPHPTGTRSSTHLHRRRRQGLDGFHHGRQSARMASAPLAAKAAETTVSAHSRCWYGPRPDRLVASLGVAGQRRRVENLATTDRPDPRPHRGARLRR
jgi:hypothetical protein